MEKTKNKVLLVGGEFQNKGAEAMTFSTIQYLRQKNPNVEIVMLLDKKHMGDPMIEKCGVKALLDQPSRRMYAAGGLSRLTTTIRGKQKAEGFKDLDVLLEDTDAVVDISGYCFTSNWGVAAGLASCAVLDAAKHHHVPYYIMPQSFGPFRYGNPAVQKLMLARIKSALSSAKLIYAREQEGYDLLTKEFGLTNVRRSYDMVLQQKGYQPELIFRDAAELQLQIPEDGRKKIAIVPNIRNEKFASQEAILAFYQQMIDTLLDKDYDIYLLSHSQEDDVQCRMICKANEGRRVYMAQKEMSCLEYEAEIVKFDFCIASRFHSIVHAYKQGVPCIALGWATKYGALLSLFGQGDYLVDISQIGIKDGAALCEALAAHREEEAEKIEKTMQDIQKENCLDSI